MVRQDDLPRASAHQPDRRLDSALLAGPALAGLLVGQFGARPAAAARRGDLPGVVVGRACSCVPAGAAPARDPAGDGAAPPPRWRLRADPLLLAMVARDRRR